MTPPAKRESGFTLIEVVIALALFALIAVAGVALVESILKIQYRTAGRLERLGEMQRAMFLIANDLGQVNDGPVSGDAATIRIPRPLSANAGLPQRIVYAVAGGSLVRTVGARVAQPILTGVGAARWQYFREGSGWLDRWPPDPREAEAWPAAVAVDLTLVPTPDRPGGTLRRVVALPSRP